MKLSEACIILENIDSSNITDIQKGIAIYAVLSMPTHKSVTKTMLLKVIKWLSDKSGLYFAIHQQAEIERLCEEAISYKDLWYKAEEDAHNAKTEAIKEFAERLKESAHDLDISFGYGTPPYVKVVTVGEIDNLVKERTEDGLDDRS
jgi:hypothetical protein